ncbi:hypothetical protein ACRALDRAFT_1073722, partial [Sodiomyces alcalophilus JCM 7366]|uniref:uncharacterized protein n=1 Tax=Sodiomyces alcalophilus JCM 7366 TaxID=591952 RepID=UPI0039B43961
MPATSKRTSCETRPSIPSSVIPPAVGNSEARDGKTFSNDATGTMSSRNVLIFSDTDAIEDRTLFLVEYNRLAKKNGIRAIVMEDIAKGKRNTTPSTMPEKKSWWSRVLPAPSQQQQEPPEEQPQAQDGRKLSTSSQSSSKSRSSRRRRSVSDLALHLVQSRKQQAKTLTLQTMVRLSGQSWLSLPPGFAPGSLILPTCLRATAQYLAEHGTMAPGIFRIPGSLRTINALYDHYCDDRGHKGVTQTIRYPNLPDHIRADVHDVASVFKRFLAVLPGGIIGCVAVFDALVAIHSHFRSEIAADLNQSRQIKLRARLIALAISTLRSRFRRELVCAVFGLLSLIGQQAENAAQGDGPGSSPFASELMGYHALGVIFGPLLVGELLADYTNKIAADPSWGSLLSPLTPTKLKRERPRKAPKSAECLPAVDKMSDVRLANDVAEMLISHWRDVVREMRSFSVLSCQGRRSEDEATKGGALRSSISQRFVIKQPRGRAANSPSSEPRGRSRTLDDHTPTRR